MSMLRSLVITLTLLVAGAAAHAQSGDRSVSNRLSELAPLEGAWAAQGEGFSSKLVYEWALPGALLRVRNELRNDAGELFGEYEGHYAWDPGESRIVFWTVGRGGELHRGTVMSRGNQLWHDARIAGGRTDGYRSVIAITSGELHYRARYERSATDEDVLGSDPLVYKRTAR